MPNILPNGDIAPRKVSVGKECPERRVNYVSNIASCSINLSKRGSAPSCGRCRLICSQLSFECIAGCINFGGAGRLIVLWEYGFREYQANVVKLGCSPLSCSALFIFSMSHTVFHFDGGT